MILERWTMGVGALAAAGAAACLVGCTELNVPKVEPGRAYIDARAVAFQAADDEDAVVRSHAMEALGKTVGPAAGGVFMQGLADSSPAVQFAAAMALGNVKHAPAQRALLKIAADADTDKRVLCAAVYALHRLGNDKHTGKLGLLLYDDNKWVRANAALAMGKMGEASAIGPLEARRGYERDPAVKLQVIESLAMLGDQRGAQLLEAFTKDMFLDMRLAAIPALGRLRTRRSAQALRELLMDRHPPRVRVAAAGALAQRGAADEQASRLCIEAVREPRRVLRRALGKRRQIRDMDVHSLQQLGAISLGWMNRPATVDVLHPLLRSPNGGVRVAAAMGILRILSAYAPAAEARGVTTRPATAPAVRKPRSRPRLHTAGGKD